MFRALLITAFASILSISAAKAETQGHGSTRGLSGFELGTRLSSRLDVKVPQSDQAKSGASGKGAVSEDEPAKKSPIRKVRVIY
jgi:hypothetical protein